MKIDERDRILRIATAVNTASDLDGIVAAVMDHVGDVLPHDLAVLALLDRSAGELEVYEFAEADREACVGGRLTPERRVPATEDHVLGWVVNRELPHLRTHLDEAQPFTASLQPGPQADSHLFAPLRGRDDVIGVLGLCSYRADAFGEADADRFSDWARLVGIAVENLRNFQEAQELSLRDPLTGAFNRRYFEQVLAKEYSRYERHGEGFALILADMDDLKQINDRFGHTAGDRALVRTIELLELHTRGADAVCRIAGDEFAILLPHADRRQACAAASHLARALREGNICSIDDRTSVPVTLSMGYAVAPADADHAAALVRCADAALYQAKDAGNARVVAYSGRPQRRGTSRQA
jgi:diguanylate cyclase (GGDEF)-like protein